MFLTRLEVAASGSLRVGKTQLYLSCVLSVCLSVLCVCVSVCVRARVRKRGKSPRESEEKFCVCVGGGACVCVHVSQAPNPLVASCALSVC